MLVKSRKRIAVICILTVFAVLISIRFYRTKLRYTYDGTKGVFCCGLLPVENDKYKWGYVNEKGKIVLPLRYTYAESFNENGIASVGIGNYNAFINTNGNNVGDSPFEEYAVLPDADDAPARAKKHGKYGYINEKARFVINNIYDDAEPFKNGCAAVCYKEKYGYIDENGDWFIEPQFDDCGSFNQEGNAIAKQGEYWGIIDTSGEWVVAPKFDKLPAYCFDGRECTDFAVVYEKGDYSHWNQASYNFEKWGLINRKGEIVLEAKYDTIFFAEDKDKYVLSNTRMDYSTNTMITKYGCADSSGNIIASVTYDENQWGYDFFGMTKEEEEAYYARIQAENEEEAAKTAHLYKSKKIDGKYVYVDENGEIVFEMPDINWGTDFYEDGYAIVSAGDDYNYGVIDINGKYVVKPKWYGLLDWTDDGA